jgi:ribonuclease HI
MWPPVRIKNV